MAKRSTPTSDDLDLRPAQAEHIPPDVAGYQLQPDPTGRGRHVPGVAALVSRDEWAQLSDAQRAIAAGLYQPLDAAQWATQTAPPEAADEATQGTAEPEPAPNIEEAS